MASGVDSINKQKFLAELSKLLTFMYEEDRQNALAAYSRMFEEAEDEQKLIQILVSPTRQAVIVARAYDAKERKLQVTAQSRESSVPMEADGEEPDYMKAIGAVRNEAMEKDILRSIVLENQMSFFGEEAEETEQPEQVQESPEQQNEETPDSESAPADEVDAFLAEFHVEDDIQQLQTNETAPPADGEDAPAEEPAPEREPVQPLAEEEEEPRREAMIGWLTLFMIFAIPVGLAACAVMVVFALAFLALAALVAVAGVFALKSLFLGFAVFADILLVGGAAIALLALALLFLWTAVWFLAGAIPSIIRGLTELGRNWCYKEVAE